MEHPSAGNVQRDGTGDTWDTTAPWGQDVNGSGFLFLLVAACSTNPAPSSVTPVATGSAPPMPITAYHGHASTVFAVAWSPDGRRIEAVKLAQRIETHFRSPQLHLWQTSDTEWLLALRRPDPAPRRDRSKIIPLARQLPLLDGSAHG